MYKVFNQNRVILFTENLTICNLSDEDSLVKSTNNESAYSVYQDFVDKNTNGRLIFLIQNDMQLFVDKFLSHFKIIEAAGGLIMNLKEELLMIHRFKKWDLPKGKIEKNESTKTAALRECMEETGIENVSIIKELENTCHIYEIDGKPILKRTYWFEMKTTSDKLLIPQFEEGIEKARWMTRKEVDEAIKNTYESLMELIENNYLKH